MEVVLDVRETETNSWHQLITYIALVCSAHDIISMMYQNQAAIRSTGLFRRSTNMKTLNMVNRQPIPAQYHGIKS